MWFGWDMEAGWKNCLYSGAVHYARFIPALLSKVISLYIPNVSGLLKGQKNENEKKSECVAGNVSIFAVDVGHGCGANYHR